MSRSPRRALLSRIDAELELAGAIPELAWPAHARGTLAIEGAGAGTIAARLRPTTFEDVSDPRLHAIAALEGARFGRAIAGPDEVALEASARALVASWAALGARRGYVQELARPIGSMPSVELASRLGVDRVVTALVDRAHAGGDLGALLRVLRACDSFGGELAALARRARFEALDVMLQPVRRSLDELATRRPSVDELVAAFAEVRSAWRRSDRDMEIEALAVERLADFAWDLYRDGHLSELARVVEEVAELSASLATRIERGESALAWAAPCAQVFVFRAELAPRFDEQVVFAERAYAVCPTLRNARLVLGDFLLTRADRALERDADRTSAGTRPEEDIARAASMHPELKRLPAIREKLARKRPSTRGSSAA